MVATDLFSSQDLSQPPMLVFVCTLMRAWIGILSSATLLTHEYMLPLQLRTLKHAHGATSYFEWELWESLVILAQRSSKSLEFVKLHPVSALFCVV